MTRLVTTRIRPTIGSIFVLLWMGCSDGPPATGTNGASIGERVGIETVGLDPEVRARIEDLQRAIDEHPDDGRVWIEFGRFLHAHDLLEGAERAYTEGLDREAGEPEDRYRLAVVHSELGHDSAHDALRALHDGNGYRPAAYRWVESALLDGRADEALPVLDRLLDEVPEDPHASRLRIRAHLAKNATDEAIAELQRFLAKRPDDRYGQFLLYSARRRAGADDLGQPPPPIGAPHWPDPWLESLDDLRIGYREQFERALAGIGSDPTSSAQILEQLRAERPASANVLINLGIAYQRIGALDRSFGALEAAVLLQPERELAHLQLAVTCGLLAQRDDDETYRERARGHAREAIALTPDSGRGYAALGAIEVAADRVEPALTAYRSAFERETSWAAPLAQLLGSEGRWKHVTEVLDRLTDEEHTAQTRFLLGAAQWTLGDPTSARASFERSLAIDPAHAEARTALDRLGQKPSK